jgi:hypothetical protein
MLDTTPITTIRHLLSTGATEQALLAAGAHLFRTRAQPSCRGPYTWRRSGRHLRPH